jgi:hypothetical protein
MRAYVLIVIPELTLAGEHEKEFSVIPAWMAGIRLARMRPETSIST